MKCGNEREASEEYVEEISQIEEGKDIEQDMHEKIKELAQMKKDGLIDDEEYKKLKEKLI
jgi:hypothetical protein